MTQEKLAEAIQIAPRSVQRIENGKVNVPLTTLLKLKRALKCSITSLVED